MSEQPSLPPPFSRTEIATIAAMLLGEIADACKYTEACEAAVSLLSIAEKVAKEPDPEIRDGSKIPWHLLGPDESQIMDPQSNIEASVKEQLVKVGFNLNTLDMEHNKKISWEVFWGKLLQPTKPSEERTPRFERWLLSEFLNDKAGHILNNARENGVPKALVVMYLRNFPDWWKGQKSEKSREAGKVGAEKKRAKVSKKKSARR